MRERSSRTGRHYAAIPNAAMRDTRVSMEARGLLAMMMTYADHWTFRKGHLVEISGMGVNKFSRVMKELQDAGYMKLRIERNGKGQVVGRTWVIVDDADTEATENAVSDDTEATENRTYGKPNLRKSPPIRRTTLKENQTTRNPIAPSGDLFAGEQVDKSKPDQNIDQDAKFQEFWAAFPPRSNPSSKKNSKPLFIAALKKIGFEDLLRATRAYAASRSGEDKKYTKGVEPWLRGEFWEAWLKVEDTSVHRSKLDVPGYAFGRAVR